MLSPAHFSAMFLFVARCLFFWRIVLAIALLGTVSSTVFLGLALLAGRRNLRIGRAQAQLALQTDAAALPRVTIFKPLHGAEPRLQENLASFFNQDYPDFELVFGCRTAADPALAIVERLRACYPQVPARVVLSGEPPWPSAKVWSLEKMIAGCSSDFFVISDSDILVGPDFLRNVIPPLLPPQHPNRRRAGDPENPEPQNGLVTCMYRGVPAADFWSHLEALGMSVEMPSGVMIADMLEGMQFAMGSVMAVRRDVLERIGGIASTAEYYSDDFVLGNRVHAAGFRVVLSHCRVGHVLCAQSFRQTFATQTRWMQSTRYSRPRGHLGTGLTFAVPFGLLGLAAGLALGHPRLGIALLASSLLNRILQCVAIGYAVIGDPQALRLCWLYPFRDLLGFIVWICSYFGGSSFQWRGERYHFTPGGRILPVSERR